MKETQEQWELFHAKEYMRGKYPKSNLWWISDHGRVKVTHGHNDKETIKRTYLTGGHLGNRYLAISVNDAPEKYVHKLVARAFLREPHAHEEVINHIDHNKLNNHVDNLEHSTHQENISAARQFVKSMTTTQMLNWYEEKEASFQSHLDVTASIVEGKLNKHQRAVELRRSGLKLEEIGETLGVHFSTIYTWLQKYMTRDEMTSLNHKTRV